MASVTSFLVADARFCINCEVSEESGTSGILFYPKLRVQVLPSLFVGFPASTYECPCSHLPKEDVLNRKEIGSPPSLFCFPFPLAFMSTRLSPTSVVKGRGGKAGRKGGKKNLTRATPPRKRKRRKTSVLDRDLARA